MWRLVDGTLHRVATVIMRQSMGVQRPIRFGRHCRVFICRREAQLFKYMTRISKGNVILQFPSGTVIYTAGSIESSSVEITIRDAVEYRMNISLTCHINPLTPNDPKRGRTAPLTSNIAFYIFIQQI